MITTLKITLPDNSTLVCESHNIPRIGEQLTANGQTGVVKLIRHIMMTNTVLILVEELPVYGRDGNEFAKAQFAKNSKRFNFGETPDGSE
jgi:hypothetical protein